MKMETLDGNPMENSNIHQDVHKHSGITKPLNLKPWYHGGNRFQSNNGKNFKFRTTNFTGVPDVSSLIADFVTVKVDKLLKSDRDPQLVTKKEYIKKDWCKTEPILQKIREDGCLTRTILNRFCYGQCNSFYIPRNPPRRNRNRNRQENEKEEEENYVFKSCGFCKPKRASWIFVTLKCPKLSPPFRKKRVHRIKQCKCLSAS